MLFRIFHQQSGAESLGDERQMIQEIPSPFKDYTRFPRIELPEVREYTTPLQNLLDARASAMHFESTGTVSRSDLSDLLSAGPRTNAKRTLEGMPFPPRNHPSGGALYPLECYLAIRRVESIPEGVYHYAPLSHELRHLIAVPSADAVYASLKPYLLSEFHNPPAILIVTSVWGRNYPKYGEYAYRLSLIEAGHMVQNMLLAGTARGLALRPCGGFTLEALQRYRARSRGPAVCTLTRVIV
jgi:SagB-type dehydrogenase family enzyme